MLLLSNIFNYLSPLSKACIGERESYYIIYDTIIIIIEFIRYRV